MEDHVADGERKVLSSAMEKLPMDFLRRFVGNGYGDEPMEVIEGDPDEIELSLGLSLGGCFGVDPHRKMLHRSSSTVSFSTLQSEHEFPVVAAAAALTRTSSLPAEVKEEQRKRKEMQRLKRLEAKRKRLERRNSIRSGATKPGEKLDEDGKESAALAAEHVICDSDPLGSLEGNNHFGGARNGVSQPGLLARTAAPRRVPEAPGCLPLVSQRSIGSQGSSSAGECELDRRPAQEAKSSSSSTAAAAAASGGGGKSAAGGAKQMARRMMEKMPFVSTRGDGPNGRRIEGFLYKYRKGGDVRIVCVCHGSFLTPAEFVRHAGGSGGGDVVNPLRHIVVNSSPFTLL